MLAYRSFRGKSKQKPSSSLQELKVVSSEEATEPVSTHKTGGKPITNTVKEATEKTENQTETQMNNMKDKAVGKN